MKHNNKKQKKIGDARSGFGYEALQFTEGEKINNAKYDFQPSPQNFQEELKIKILEQRNAKQNQMNKIFEILTTSLPSKYSISALTIAILNVLPKIIGVFCASC